MLNLGEKSYKRDDPRYLKAYHAHHAMMERCYNWFHPNYKNWGARGIKVDYRWHRFDLFLADMGLPELGMTLDRRDNNLGYSKANCRWVPARIQHQNKRTNVLNPELVEQLKADRAAGMKYREICRKHGLKHATIYNAINGVSWKC